MPAISFFREPLSGIASGHRPLCAEDGTATTETFPPRRSFSRESFSWLSRTVLERKRSRRRRRRGRRDVARAGERGEWRWRAEVGSNSLEQESGRPIGRKKLERGAKKGRGKREKGRRERERERERGGGSKRKERAVRKRAASRIGGVLNEIKQLTI